MYRSGIPEMGPDHSEQKLDPTDVDDNANSAQRCGIGRIITTGSGFRSECTDAIIRIIERLQPGLCTTSVLQVLLQRVAGDGAQATRLR